MPDIEFERRVSAALRANLRSDPAARSRIMQRVREAAREQPHRRQRGFGRGARQSVVGLALAAGVGSVTTLSALLPPEVGAGGARSVVIGDTVVATLRDTLRLVRLMFDDAGARGVVVVGDFNGWRAGATPLAREAMSRRWSATLALHDGSHRYAFVVDGLRWVPDPSAEHARAPNGRVYSLLHVSRATN